MTLAQFSLGALVLFPLLASALSVLFSHKVRAGIGLAVAAVVLCLTAPVLMEAAAGETVTLALGGYEPPLGITLRADGLSVLFLTLTGVVGSVVTGYAAALPHSTGERLITTSKTTAVRAAPPSTRTRTRPGHPGFWPLWLGCWSGLNAVFVSGDLFNTYVGLELVGLSAVALVALGGRSAWQAALRYLFIAVIGSLLYLVGVALLVSTTGTLDIMQASAALAEEPSAQEPAVFALVLMTVGLGLKIALVPMHRWLVPAHSGAPGSVSPILSALVIKAALFVILRCWLWVLTPGITATTGADDGERLPALAAVTVLAWLLAGLGTAAIILGSVMAIRQTRLKPLVAYSTVAQVGYWFLFFPILLDPEADALEGRATAELADEAVLSGALGGSVALALGHGIAKAALFLAAGYLKELYGTDEISKLRGASQHHPMLVLAMGLSAIGLAGLPVSLGFTGKWQLATAALAAEHYWILVVLVVGTLLSAAYLLRAIAPLLMQEEDDETAVELPERQISRHPRFAQLAPFVLGTLTVATGFMGVWSDQLTEQAYSEIGTAEVAP